MMERFPQQPAVESKQHKELLHELPMCLLESQATFLQEATPGRPPYDGRAACNTKTATFLANFRIQLAANDRHVHAGKTWQNHSRSGAS